MWVHYIASFSKWLQKYIFHIKPQLFVVAKSDNTPDPHGSALVWLPGSGSALR
jgi:hypothetical protein